MPMALTFTVLLLLIYLLIQTQVFFSGMTFFPFENFDHGAVLVSIDLPSNSKRDAPLHFIANDYSRGNWDGLRDHLRDIPWEYIFKLGTSAATNEFYEWFQVGIDLYLSF